MALSGKFVQMPSIPSSISRDISRLPSTVHAYSARPLRWQSRAISSLIPAKNTLTACRPVLTAVPACVASAAATRRTIEQARGYARLRRAHAFQRLREERPDHRVRQRVPFAHDLGDALLDARLLDLDHQHRLADRQIEHLGERRHRLSAGVQRPELVKR